MKLSLRTSAERLPITATMTAITVSDPAYPVVDILVVVSLTDVYDPSREAAEWGHVVEFSLSHEDWPFDVRGRGALLGSSADAKLISYTAMTFPKA